MKFPASEQEKKRVYELVSEVEKSLKNSSKLLKCLIEELDESYLAVNLNPASELIKNKTEIGSLMWKLNIILYKMQDHQERIVHCEQAAAVSFCKDAVDQPSLLDG